MRAKSRVCDHLTERKSDKKNVVCQYEVGNKAKCGAELGANLTTMAYHLTCVHHIERGHGPVSCALFGCGRKSSLCGIPASVKDLIG